MYNFIFFIVMASSMYVSSEVYYDEILLWVGIRDSLEPWNTYIHLQTEWGNGRYHWWGTPWYSDLVTQKELMFKIFSGEMPQRFSDVIFTFPFPDVKIKPLQVFDFPEQENYVWVTGYLMAMEHYMLMSSIFEIDSVHYLEEVQEVYSCIKSGACPADREKIVIDLLRNKEKSFFLVEKVLHYSPKVFVAQLEEWVNFNYENLKNVPDFENFFTDEKSTKNRLEELINFYNDVKNREECWK